jgi:CRISPR/Cas system-associated protein Csm6
MTNKTFNTAGVSTLNGVTKVRFANDYVGRFKILAKNGHTDINLIELGQDLTKAEICKVLMAHEQFQDEAAQTAITEFVVRNCKEVAAELETKVEAAEDAEAELA